MRSVPEVSDTSNYDSNVDSDFNSEFIQSNGLQELLVYNPNTNASIMDERSIQFKKEK